MTDEMRRLLCPIALCLNLLGAQAGADVTLPSVFGDSMVLQRESEVPIWGWANPGEAVTVEPSWSGAGITAEADDEGHWRVVVETPEAGGPHEIKIAGTNTITLSDVLLGEVWLCSGQSNMEWPVSRIGPGSTGIAGVAQVLAEANRPGIRLLMVPNTISLHPRTDLRMSWAPATPETVRDFSAVGYFFGMKLQDELDVPIGLISADWGGTRIEAWTSPAALAGFDEYKETIEHLAMLADPEGRSSVLGDMDEGWWNGLDEGAPGGAAWTTANATSWKSVELPATFGGELGSFDGVIFMRRDVDLDRSWAGIGAMLELGSIDDMDDVWVNGKHVGGIHESGRWNEARRYDVPAGVLREGRNEVAIRVLDTGGLATVGGVTDEVVIKSISSSLDLSGPWHYAFGRTMSQLPARMSADLNANSLTVLYHAMIESVAPYAIRGAIWYQGESNRENAARYADLMRTMIGDWRSLWGRGPFPFYFVQIAPFNYGGDAGETALLREAQLRALDTMNTGMVVTMDIGNPQDIHPTNKQDVGHRLARWALGQTYGHDDVVCSGPLYQSMTVHDDEIHLAFRFAETGLEVREPAGFLIAGADRRFVTASARVDGETLIVSSPGVAEPVAVRYAWDAVGPAGLFNGEGLPASPFRTDDWDDGVEMAP
jgi:sialate O-acetylesterase